MPRVTTKLNKYVLWEKKNSNAMTLIWILNSLTQDITDSVIFSITT